MLTRCLSMSIASSLHSIPGATCSHSGSDHCGCGVSTGSFPVSSAMRRASRACSDVVGRSTSVGQGTNLSTTGRRLSSSHRQSGHEAICASAAATSLAGESCRAYAQVVSLCPQRSDCLIPGECELCIPPTTSNASFWIGPGRRAAAKKAPLRYAGRTRRRAPRTSGRAMDALDARDASMKDIFGAGDEDAGAARLAPDALVACSRRTVIVIAGHELLLVDPQFTIEEMQLFDASVGMRR